LDVRLRRGREQRRKPIRDVAALYWNSSKFGHRLAQRALLDKYCLTCHNQRLRTAGLTLDTADVNNVAARPELWEKVLHKVRTGEMPPVRMPRPDQATFDAFGSWLETSLDRAAAE